MNSGKVHSLEKADEQTDDKGHLRAEWKAFAEKNQDRIVGVGFDGAHPEQFTNPEVYTKSLAIYRTMLVDLSPDAATKIGFKNARKLFGVE